MHEGHGCSSATSHVSEPTKGWAAWSQLEESFNRACAGRVDPVELAGDRYLNFAERRGLGPQFQLSLL